MADLDFLKTVDNLTSEETCAPRARLCLMIVRRSRGSAQAVYEPHQRKTTKKVVKIDTGKKEGAVVEEEKKCLEKVCKRFKAGSMQRWEQIADYINTQLALSVPRTTRSARAISKASVDPKQHAERVKQANQAPPPPVDGWSADQQKQLEKHCGTSSSMEKNAWSGLRASPASRSATASRASGCARR